ncbi:MAG: hypothetical protein CFE23_02760 [Flavobacterium sp. BFFFF1]|uniref:hypothetical protein n=1 Tax=Flavobacterium sp. BFFFF1 TaxID=2015557 RepID=UPI000BD2AA99|nr:hypothetical protein [Flavobacterium sp. BFFFF1]OYU81817.1 MAG: hypothetical protein CFE23_02760 [Flavobacterium sp. BFFFF1]
MKNRNYLLRIAGIIILIIVGLNAVYAGIVLIVYPNGEILGLSRTILKYSPFTDFYIPGIFLLVLNGISSITVAISTAANKKYYPRLITMQGIILVFWLVFQVNYLRKVTTLQLAMLLLGILLISIGEIITVKKST